MLAARFQSHGRLPIHEDTVFDIRFEDWEIRDGYCQLQMRLTRRAGFSSVRIDWGDGTVQDWTDLKPWHNFRSPGTFRVRIGVEAKWWRLWDSYTVTADRQILVSRPAIFPRRWSDFIESADGTFCGWSNATHGGVQGPVIPWGRSITTAFCCYQYCSDLTGGFPLWTDSMTDATGTFEGCVKMRGRVPKWGRNIVSVSQCFSNCPGACGPFPAWPEGCADLRYCFKNATGMHGGIPAWPDAAEDLTAVFDGCVGAVGSIPPWPENLKRVSQCFRDCAGLTGAWTDDPSELMPEDKVRISESYFDCYDVVTGCADSLRALFWDKNWGGTIPRPE